MIKKGSAVWEGSFKEGSGTISTESGALKKAAYGVSARFDTQPGSNPEELIAAAHASCFSMALSLMLGEAGFEPASIETTAAVKLEKVGDGYAITSSHLSVHARIPGIDQDKFSEVASLAKAGCPVSKVLNAEITMDATLLAD
ncbi:MAG TPA: OsmC family protein [Burkholderiaceae bacterium]|jgi:osmotically inducible protein OsmC|nr:OsmC family protein [Burkholderiaceae bacterium]